MSAFRGHQTELRVPKIGRRYMRHPPLAVANVREPVRAHLPPFVRAIEIQALIPSTTPNPAQSRKIQQYVGENILD